MLLDSTVVICSRTTPVAPPEIETGVGIAGGAMAMAEGTFAHSPKHPAKIASRISRKTAMIRHTDTKTRHATIYHNRFHLHGKVADNASATTIEAGLVFSSGRL